MGDDLKPCPFCGSTEPRVERNHTRPLWEVECHACWAMMTSTISRSKVVHDWNRRWPEDTMRARAEAAEARAAQAEADARLMAGLAFASFVARTSFSAEIVDASLLDALDAAGDHAAAVSDADMLAAVRRILAAGGAA